MAMTRNQRRRAEFADRLEKTFGPNQDSKELRTQNGKVEQKKRRQHAKS